MSVDRDALIAAVDLPSLADELLGGHRGHGRAARWASPVPGHPQTGRTPPMSIFTSRTGEQRWTCFATGTSGTAIDLVMTARRLDAGAAMVWLAARSGTDRHVARQPPPPAVRPKPERPVSPAVEAYVGACAETLWRRPGGPVRRWLMAQRGLGEEVLRANRVGADPGGGAAAGLLGPSRWGPAAVFPVLAPDGTAVYVQARPLHPGSGPKYRNPRSALAANPRLAYTVPVPVRSGVRGSGGPRPLVVCEGLPDALTAAHLGHAAVGVLGAGAASREAVDRLAGHRGVVLVAFDADAAGDRGAADLVARIVAAGGAACRLRPPDGHDVNDWHRDDGDGLTRAVAAAAAAGRRTRSRAGLGR
ncbi:MAG: toprim domain-containing protein [Actinobacteria bacterium]|nr:toprim domain-containing protein [Actinomycetota bacterium]